MADPKHGPMGAVPERGAWTALRCPLCLGALREDGGALCCAACMRQYSTQGGLADFRSGAPAGGAAPDLPVIADATPDGWTDAVRRFLAGRSDSLYMLDALVAGRNEVWRGFLDLGPKSRVLCLGSGYGSIVQSLTAHCERVFVLEPDVARLRFAVQRLSIQGLADAVTCLAGGAEQRLPFADASLDAVVMAEPATFDASAPLLGEIRRVLSDGGQLLLIADNRLSLALPNGWWDRPVVAAWPLPDLTRAAGILTAWWRRAGGRTSLRTLRRRMAAQGLEVATVLGLWPSRRQTDEILPLDAGAFPALPGESRSRRQRFKRSGVFLPAHCLIAQAGGRRRRSSYDRICAAVARDLSGSAEGPPVRPLRYFMTRKDKLIIRASCGNADLVVRLPFSAAAAAAEDRHAAALARLAVSHPGLAPTPLAAGRHDGLDYRVETALAGLPLRRAMRGRRSADFLGHVEGLLETMNPSASLAHAPLEGAAFARLVEARLERLCQIVTDRDQQRRLRAFFRSRLEGASLPLGLVHGDFSASNIYIAGDRAAIVDWEAADHEDLPILDAIGYLESILRPFSPQRSLAEGFHALARRNFPSEAEERFLLARYELMRIDPTLHTGLVYLRWLRQIDHLAPYWLNYDPDGQERYVHQVVRLLLDEDAVSRK